MIGLYAGSFSVPTMGHMDIIRRAAAVLDGLVVAILVNPEKRYAFSPERRARWLEKAVEDLPNVRVVWDNGLLVDVAKRCGAGVIVRGVRGESDLGYEMPLAEAPFGGAGHAVFCRAARTCLSVFHDCDGHCAPWGRCERDDSRTGCG